MTEFKTRKFNFRFTDEIIVPVNIRFGHTIDGIYIHCVGFCDADEKPGCFNMIEGYGTFRVEFYCNVFKSIKINKLKISDLKISSECTFGDYNGCRNLNTKKENIIGYKRMNKKIVEDIEQDEKFMKFLLRETKKALKMYIQISAWADVHNRNIEEGKVNGLVH